MTPTEVGQSYDTIAHRWQTPEHPLTGGAQHKRAMQFIRTRGYALDVGCGCNGRHIDLFRSEGFEVDGIDVSERMIALARERDPDVHFYHADICVWTLPRPYDFISAWDSIWHVPLTAQESVLRKLCDGLAVGGVLIFTTGAVDRPGETQDAHMGPPMYTAAMGIPKTLALLADCECICRHLEYDQFPQPHLYIIAEKV